MHKHLLGGSASLLLTVSLLAQEVPPPYYPYPYGPETKEQRSITLEEALAAASRHATSYSQAIASEKIASEDVRQARAALLPEISMPLAYIGTTPSSRQIPGEPDVASFAPANGIHETFAFLGAGGRVDINGALRAQVRRSRELLNAAAAGTATARRELIIATADAYHALSQARQLRRLADETLALAEAFVLLTRRLVSESRADETELLRAEADALRLRDELEQARAGEAIAANVLRAYTGIEFTAHIGVERPTTALPPLEPFEDYSEQRLAQWPSLLDLDAQIRAALEEVTIARAESLPQAYYGLSWGFDSAEFGHIRPFTGASVTLGLSVPIFDFGARRGRQLQSRVRADALSELRSQRLHEIKNEFYTARASAFAARERIRYSLRRTTLSERALDLLLDRYKERRATITELIDAHTAYAESRADLYQAVTEYKAARMRLAPDPSTLDFHTTVDIADEVQTPVAVCTLTLEDSPDLYGVRLGSRPTDVLTRFPKARSERFESIGVLSLEVSGSELGPSSDPRLTPERLVVQFAHERLAYARVDFRADAPWPSRDAFLAAAVKEFRLHGPWRSFYDWRDKNLDDVEDLREFAAECEGFSVRVGTGSERIRQQQTPHIEIQDTVLWDFEKRRESDLQRQRRPAAAIPQ